MTKSDSVEYAIKSVREILTTDGGNLRSFLYKDILTSALKCQDLDIFDLKIIDRAVAEIPACRLCFQAV